MSFTVFLGIMIPFFGTALGAALCFFIKHKNFSSLENIMSGFAGGVMLAASIWSLILPAFEILKHQNSAFLRVIFGVVFGIIFIIISDKLICFIGKKTQKSQLNKRFSFIFAVVLHNIPEGIAAGVAFSAAICCSGRADLTAPFILALSIALQNIPEGAIISMPLISDGKTKGKAFTNGVLSGAVEPVAAFSALIFSSFADFLLPYLLSFAAGAMILVTTKELIPSALKCDSTAKISFRGATSFLFGFLIMMCLDLLS